LSKKLFISWAKSGALATACEEFIRNVSASHVITWCSATQGHLSQGPHFNAKILEEIWSSDYCLAVLTEESIREWWLNFETGAFYGQKKSVFGLICGDLSHKTIQGEGHPLGVNGTNFTFPKKLSWTDFFTSLGIPMSHEQIVNGVKMHFPKFDAAYKKWIKDQEDGLDRYLSDTLTD
jgi:hypothetical protein